MADLPREPKSPYVKLAEAIGGSSVAIFFIAALFGGQIWPAAAATAALAFFGLGVAYFISKPR